MLDGEVAAAIVDDDGGNLSGEIVGSGDDDGPGLFPLDEAGVGGLGAEDEEEGEGRGGELVGEGGGAEEGEEVREEVEEEGLIVGDDGGGKGGEEEDGRDEGEDDAGGEAGEDVAEVAEGAAVVAPVLVGVEGALLLHVALLHGVGPIRDGAEERD